MKKLKWVCLAIVALILIAGIGLGAEVFWYYPHLVQNKRELVAAEQSADEIRVMSCNLRCITPLDPGKKSWFYRADLIVKNIEKENPGIIGFQEATKMQYKYMCDTLVGYDSVIDYRDNSIISEGCPIFYRTDLYELIDKGSFWLSETPDVMSKDWGAAFNRICSYVILKENASGKEFVVFNTHLDHVSDEARINGINVVLDKIEQFGSLPSMIMGDFNAAEGSQTYESATESFLDAKYQTENTMESCTYEGYGESLGGKAIDHLMISKTGLEVKSYKVVTDTYDGVYPSDHFQLSVVLTLS